MKSGLRPGTIAVVFLAAVGLLVFAGGAFAQSTAPTRRPEPAHSGRSGTEFVANNSPSQNRDVDLKTIDEELQVLQQSINNLSKKPQQSSDEASGSVPSANVAPPVPARPVASSAAPVASAGAITPLLCMQIEKFDS